MARPVGAALAARPEPADGPLTAEHFHQLDLARQRGKSLRRAVRVALFNGWSLASVAVPSLVFGLFSLSGLLLGIVLAVAAYNEFAGARALRRFDERAPRRLGFNQLGLCGALIIYAIWGLCSDLGGSSPYDAALAGAGQASELLGSIESLQTTLTLAVYGGLIVFTIIFQGGTAWYYFTRARIIRSYVRETPAWIVDLERNTSPQ